MHPFFILGPMPFFPFRLPSILVTGRTPTNSSLTSLLSPNLNWTHYDVIAVYFCREANRKKSKHILLRERGREREREKIHHFLSLSFTVIDHVCWTLCLNWKNREKKEKRKKNLIVLSQCRINYYFNFLIKTSIVSNISLDLDFFI